VNSKISYGISLFMIWKGIILTKDLIKHHISHPIKELTGKGLGKSIKKTLWLIKRASFFLKPILKLGLLKKEGPVKRVSSKGGIGELKKKAQRPKGMK